MGYRLKRVILRVSCHVIVSRQGNGMATASVNATFSKNDKIVIFFKIMICYYVRMAPCHMRINSPEQKLIVAA
jgi:hypothetical protein